MFRKKKETKVGGFVKKIDKFVYRFLPARHFMKYTIGKYFLIGYFSTKFGR